MIQVHSFTFGPFQENTYVLSDETKECVIIDPGCYDRSERAQLAGYISEKKLRPVRLLNTHGHIDHVFGNKFISESYQLGPEIHKKDLSVLDSLMQVAQLYGLQAEPSPAPSAFLDEGDTVAFGRSALDVLFAPGHSPGSICFVSRPQKFVIGGDVLFYGSIGRTDLPGGDYDTLIGSIRTRLFPLGDDFTVYSGHGPETTIGFERKHNPFVGEGA
ncbi:MAG: MBL fold metallo-hydrolase [Bacteroidota bacterium]